MANISRAERERRAALSAEQQNQLPAEEGEGGVVEADLKSEIPPVADEAEGDPVGEVILVKMTRDGVDADVHPFEVEHMQLHNWVIAE